MKLIANIWYYYSGKVALIIIGFFIGLALIAGILADEKNGLIIKHSPNSISVNAKPYLSPGTKYNGKIFWLGTDNVGRDVASGIIHGSRWALLAGICSVLIASFIGLVIGLISGYFGDDQLKMSWIELLIWILFYVVSGFYIKYLDFSVLGGIYILILTTIIGIFLFNFVKRYGQINRALKASYISLPIDLIFNRVIEIFKSIPGLFLLLILVSHIQRPSIFSLILIIGCLSWTVKARLIRAELLQVREMNYIKSARVSGLSNFKILVFNALPNAIYPLYVLFAFSVSSAIVLEATLSFLGLGLNSITVTWGGLLNAARNNYSAWWLAVFPGTCIFLLVLAFNLLGDCMRELYEH